jgi:hypothetical protein
MIVYSGQTICITIKVFNPETEQMADPDSITFATYQKNSDGSFTEKETALAYTAKVDTGLYKYFLYLDPATYNWTGWLRIHGVWSIAAAGQTVNDLAIIDVKLEQGK